MPSKDSREESVLLLFQLLVAASIPWFMDISLFALSSHHLLLCVWNSSLSIMSRSFEVLCLAISLTPCYNEILEKEVVWLHSLPTSSSIFFSTVDLPLWYNCSSPFAISVGEPHLTLQIFTPESQEAGWGGEQIWGE
jgi:hypothetical protein